MLKLTSIGSVLCTVIMACACSSTPNETHRSIESKQVTSAKTNYNGSKQRVGVGQFHNRTSYLQGVFSNGNDQLGSQAKTILKTHLQQTGRFTVADRANLKRLKQEADYNQTTQSITGAQYIITGDVTEFGRKVTGDTQLFGIIGRGKHQTAYSKVALNVVDVTSGEIVHSALGAGEFKLSDRQLAGFGGTSGYDSTLSDKVLNLAITEAVNQLVSDLEAGIWPANNNN